MLNNKNANNLINAYSQAFVNVLVQQKLPLKQYYGENKQLIALFSNNLHWFHIWSQLSRRQLQAFFADVLQKTFLKQWFSLWNLLIIDSKLNFLPAILNKIQRLLAQKLTIISGKLYSVISLSLKQSQTIKITIEKCLNSKIELENLLDPRLIGGILVEIGRFKFDNSLQTQLKELSKQMIG